ncbi:MAG: ABC transporter ATP-binding protein [Bacteroidetes bacterium]|nr:MAG: ABC transporter ATP-binding protein [Bacteroidota bacterium]TAG88270.1 MAG: ABC transporter ATP-binding protein [Bacteroidota bacterium]
MIKIQNISKTYTSKAQKINALQNVSFFIEKGEFVGLMGASGSGKTTLFKVIAGLENIDEGEIYIDNQAIHCLSEKQKTLFRLNSIGFIFQQHNLMPVLSAWENVALLLELKGIKRKIAKNISLEYLEKVNLLDCAFRKPEQLSGGQQQRVAIARALAGKPVLVLADEATANLDADNTENLLEMLVKLNQEEKTTFIFATHDDRVKQKVKRIILLKNGILDEKND